MKQHITDAWHSLWRNGWMSVAAVSAVTVTLILVSVLLAGLLNVNRLSEQVESDVAVRVYIAPGTSSSKRATLKRELVALPAVKQVTYRSKDQELKSIVASYGRQWEMFSGDQNPLNDIFLVKANTPQATTTIAKRAKKLAHTSDVTYGGQTTKRMFKAMSTLQNVGLGIMILVLFVAVVLISNTIRLTIVARQNEIEIMHLVGATSAYIRWPFLMEGAFTGLLGAIIPAILVNAGYPVAYHGLQHGLVDSGYTLYAPWPFMGWLTLLLIIIGVLIGALGALGSMRRYLK